jgi:hypothetical protein
LKCAEERLNGCFTNREPEMKRYASFDDYLKAQNAGNQASIRALRRLVKRVAPGLSEAVKWGNGCWVSSNGPVAYVYSAADHVQFGFFNGSSLKDPRGLLEGQGKYVRHTKVRNPSEIDEQAFAALLRQAVGSPHDR